MCRFCTSHLGQVKKELLYRLQKMGVPSAEADFTPDGHGSDSCYEPKSTLASKNTREPNMTACCQETE